MPRVSAARFSNRPGRARLSMNGDSEETRFLLVQPPISELRVEPVRAPSRCYPWGYREGLIAKGIAAWKMRSRSLLAGSEVASFGTGNDRNGLFPVRDGLPFSDQIQRRGPVLSPPQNLR